MEFVLYFIPLIGALSTFALQIHFHGNLVRVASGVTLLFGLVVSLLVNSHGLTFDNLLTLFYAGTFVGMSSKQRHSYIDMVIASFILAGIYALIYREINQLGGALGFMSFCSVLVSVAVRKIHSAMTSRTQKSTIGE